MPSWGQFRPASSMSPPGETEIRFAFGENWQCFLERLSEDRIVIAEQSLTSMLKGADLAGCSFIDVGSGSGLFSLAARRLGARVRSFDYDPASVACTAELRRRYCDHDPGWIVESGSILDESYIGSLGVFDIVYSWGVLHHTGAMWQALGNITELVRPGGLLIVAIYNDQGRASRVWRRVKRVYVSAPKALRWVMLVVAGTYLWSPSLVRGILQGNPLQEWRTYSSQRGMSKWHDLVDWVGGYPFEVASPGEIFEFYRRRGFVLMHLVSRSGLGCNEYHFERRRDGVQ